MAQIILIGVTRVKASDVNLDLEIKNHVEEILNSSFENVSRSYFNDDPLRKGMDHMIHGINKPNDQAMQLSCVWESMQHASSRIQAEVTDTRGLDSLMKSRCRQLSHSKCHSDSFQPLFCNKNNPYRSIDGTCNNINNPRLGSASQPFGRYLDADYGDGVDSPRAGKPYTRLPNARKVSNIMAMAAPRRKTNVSVMFMQWGQFLSHDITFTTPETMNIDCCTNNKLNGNHKPLDEACMPIDVRDDSYFREFGFECLGVVRSLPVAKGCSFEKREQLNANTAFVDASQVYGSSAKEANRLRTKSGGQLKITNNLSNGKPMPPFGNIPNAPKCPFAEPSKNCFLAGDGRIDLVPGLIAMHTAFIRLHNILATELESHNAHWSDEKIYQEARRIVGALVQQITYRDWLPILLGPKQITKYNLNVGHIGYSDTYKPNEDPTVKNVFSTAAFRFGHTLPGNIVNAAVASNDFPQAGHFFDNSVLQKAETSPSSILKGMARCPMEAVDTVIGSTLRNELFASSAGKHGEDLVSTNLMRGRDHGIPAYTEWRHICGLSNVTNLEELQRVMDPRIAREFDRIYEWNIINMDLYAAGLAENPQPGSLLGPTFTCILARQFSQLKHGDRFWYERRGQPNSFTSAQLHSIKQTSLASILCKVTEGSNYSFQENPFYTTDVPGNDVKRCNNYHFMNLCPWKEY
ncbi:unnamed protein product [Meganyctiphanes norvegica]|uniref:Peroxidase n=1 Tax=Meganyctiphanes norvegica TaxID=48144 RepID=A0AAV2RK17_MEGNR